MDFLVEIDWNLEMGIVIKGFEFSENLIILQNCIHVSLLSRHCDL